MKKYARELLKHIRASGVKIISTSLTGGGHLRIEFLNAAGEPRLYHTGSSPSDGRSMDNAVAAIKRIAREGLEVAHDPR